MFFEFSENNLKHFFRLPKGRAGIVLIGFLPIARVSGLNRPFRQFCQISKIRAYFRFKRE